MNITKRMNKPQSQLSKKDFWYDLPKELIAQQPIEPRDQSRLFVYDRKSRKIEHRKFSDIVEYLAPGDLLILNNTKVMPARLHSTKKDTGGKIEIFLLKKVSREWQVMLGGRVHENSELIVSDKLEAKVLKNNQDGTWQVAFNLSGKALMAEIEKVGHMPLPPYIRKGLDKVEDKERYQTVFSRASKKESVAAPTAGLHFTKRLLEKLKAKGVEIGEVTLHVGIGTFAPVKAEKIADHKMHAERYEVTKELIEKVRAVKRQGGRVIAVGTTASRTLETVAKFITGEEELVADLAEGWTDIFMYPGRKFKVVDALVTNFHLPESTLLMLLAAFLQQIGKVNGIKIEQELYKVAIEQRYRFFSYGDAMLIT